jgi:predicted nuclease of predicted toxin-antitoxin system
MKLLLDENLSYRLVRLISDLFPGSAHVVLLGLNKGTADQDIWNYAKREKFAILTADSDFVLTANRLGPPPKVLLLENCDYPTSAAAELIRASAIRIAQFERDDAAILRLRKK